MVYKITNILDTLLDTPTANAHCDIPCKIYDDLIQKGHKVDFSDETIGGGQAIFIDREKGKLIGGSDSRKDGCAIGY